MHPTITQFKAAVAARDEAAVMAVLAEDVRFMPPTYWATWTGREPVAAVLGHVIQVFSDFGYRRIMGDGPDWALEFQCKVGDLDAVGVDLLTLNDVGLIQTFEVVMQPHKTIGALRDAMNARVMTDARFLKYRKALASG
ncbi:nuclear transport factor 2 family protein [Aliiroseovarius subalbicans]|uniref:nuclear transport factor 2 family protein n=1 Tax=Aliiroseovarius subalbicans TaxID=2925840 RepID=UPI001F5743AA|nr:nuclear transport factor 2 family protein [Aliiroseovarius subalbicans]MCI2400211.1 nuclear transport factor 2 family protein [Aliiroseovarius subalbicans]